jgi:hypothetical protein
MLLAPTPAARAQLSASEVEALKRSGAELVRERDELAATAERMARGVEQRVRAVA